jgi:hypothetical protein
MSIALIPPTIMKGWDELEAYIARIPKENRERFSSTARVKAKVTFIRKPDDDFRVIEIRPFPSLEQIGCSCTRKSGLAIAVAGLAPREPATSQ